MSCRATKYCNLCSGHRVFRATSVFNIYWLYFFSVSFLFILVFCCDVFVQITPLLINFFLQIFISACINFFLTNATLLCRFCSHSKKFFFCLTNDPIFVRYCKRKKKKIVTVFFVSTIHLLLFPFLFGIGLQT